MTNTITETGRLYLRWALTDGIGPITFTRVLNHFGDAAVALGASAVEFEKVHGIGRVLADKVVRSRDEAAIDGEIEAAAANGARIICRADPEYPPGLRQIPDAPIVLFVKGELRETDTVAMAIVGTRRCSIYAGEQARRFGELLAGAGLTVVSGLARGVDAFAHHGALDAGGRTLAVLGAGLTEIYPPENASLAERILPNGAWISELPMCTSVRRENFPSRNRIIAGMTLGTLVIEAPMRSGALITARLASDYNREVFAVPGRLQEPTAAGTNALIRDGVAKLVTCLEDVLDELGEVGLKLRATGGAEPDAKPAGGEPGGAVPVRLSAAEERVLSIVPVEPMLQDVVLRAAELPPGEVLAALTTLELKGLVKRWPGNLVSRGRQA
ncbi:MAG: DNA-processing protein DprA [Phycisphaerae bacterium]|jgi:DNA processing protein